MRSPSTLVRINFFIILGCFAICRQLVAQPEKYSIEPYVNVVMPIPGIGATELGLGFNEIDTRILPYTDLGIVARRNFKNWSFGVSCSYKTYTTLIDYQLLSTGDLSSILLDKNVEIKQKFLGLGLSFEFMRDKTIVPHISFDLNDPISSSRNIPSYSSNIGFYSDVVEGETAVHNIVVDEFASPSGSPYDYGLLGLGASYELHKRVFVRATVFKNLLHGNTKTYKLRVAGTNPNSTDPLENLNDFKLTSDVLAFSLGLSYRISL